MLDRTHGLPVKRQAELLGISRDTVYYHPELVAKSELALMRRMGIQALYRNGLRQCPRALVFRNPPLPRHGA